MNDNKLTYILLLIASVFLILNGIFAFEKSIIMVLLSFFFIIIGLLLGFVAIHYLLKLKHKKEEHQCSSFLHVKQFYLHIFRLHYMIN